MNQVQKIAHRYYVDVNNLVAIAPYGNKVESSVKSLASIINEQNNYVRMLKH